MEIKDKGEEFLKAIFEDEGKGSKIKEFPRNSQGFLEKSSWLSNSSNFLFEDESKDSTSIIFWKPYFREGVSIFVGELSSHNPLLQIDPTSSRAIGRHQDNTQLVFVMFSGDNAIVGG